MQNHSDPYVVSCPVGCAAPLQDTAIQVAEGALRRCTACGQLLSRASEARYSETMAQFNAADFNAPQGGELARRQTVARQRLSRIAALLDKPPRDIHVVDVGCSRGQFVAAAIAAGYHAEGVEPAPRIAEAAGGGWAQLASAPVPRDHALLALAQQMCQSRGSWDA